MLVVRVPDQWDRVSLGGSYEAESRFRWAGSRSAAFYGSVVIKPCDAVIVSFCQFPLSDAFSSILLLFLRLVNL